MLRNKEFIDNVLGTETKTQSFGTSPETGNSSTLHGFGDDLFPHYVNGVSYRLSKIIKNRDFGRKEGFQTFPTPDQSVVTLELLQTLIKAFSVCVLLNDKEYDIVQGSFSVGGRTYSAAVDWSSLSEITPAKDLTKLSKAAFRLYMNIIADDESNTPIEECSNLINSGITEELAAAFLYVKQDAPMITFDGIPLDSEAVKTVGNILRVSTDFEDFIEKSKCETATREERATMYGSTQVARLLKVQE